MASTSLNNTLVNTLVNAGGLPQAPSGEFPGYLSIAISHGQELASWSVSLCFLHGLIPTNTATYRLQIAA